MKNIQSVCVFCGSSNKGNQNHHQEAALLGKILAENSIKLVYGGAKVGLMNIVAETVMQHKGHVTGIIPQHLVKMEGQNTNISDLIIVETMHIRKQMMFEKSDAIIVLPGGFGTLDEVFEVLTWKQLDLHDKPIIFVNSHGYWTPFITLIDHLIKENYAHSSHRDLVTFINTAQDIVTALSKEPEPRQPVNVKWV